MTASQLVPVVPGTIGNVPCLTVDGRSLHGVLGVRRDFSNWIKGRISKYGFVDGQDFEVFAKTGENPNFDSPDLANQKKRGGDRRSQEYRLTVGMGKELCMVENNEHGRVARRYFIECERRLLSPQPTSEPSPISKRNDPERKALTAIINTWVSMAPVHYAAARAQVNAHFGVASVDALTVAQVKEAIQWVQAKIDALPPASAQPALPAVPEKDKFEAYIEKVEQFRAEVRKEMYRLEKEGVDMVNAYKFGAGNLGCFIHLISLWLRDVVISPTPLIGNDLWNRNAGLEDSPIYLIKTLEKVLTPTNIALR